MEDFFLGIGALCLVTIHGDHDVTNHLSGTSLTKGMIINQCGITDTRDLFPSFGIRTKDWIVRSMDDMDPTTTIIRLLWLLLLLFQCQIMIMKSFGGIDLFDVTDIGESLITSWCLVTYMLSSGTFSSSMGSKLLCRAHSSQTGSGKSPP